MQSSSEHGAVPEPTSEVSKKASKGSNNDGGKGANNGSGSKRMKTSRACDECRKRKVKCDGLQPCERCRRAEIDCIFAKQPPKRGPPKQYIEHLEARLQLVERAILTIDGPARQILAEALATEPGKDTESDAMVAGTEDHDAMSSPTLSTQSTTDVDRFTLNMYGQGQYINDVRARSIHEESSMGGRSPVKPTAADSDLLSDAVSMRDVDSPPSQLSQMMDMDPASQSEPHATFPGLPPDVSPLLIEAYFAHIHRYLPMLHKKQFLRQAASKTDPPSPLLVYAMCAVASHWVGDQTNTGDDASGHPGINYYNRAFLLIEEYSDAPRLATIQALVLLAKYQENYIRPGYRFRPGMFLSLAVSICKDLSLQQMESNKGTDESRYETEIKKRTFWTVFVYDLIFSMEQGREPSFTASACKVGFPMPTPEESPETEDLILNYNRMIQLSKILSDIYFMSRRTSILQQNRAVDLHAAEYVVEQNGRILLLSTHLENFIHELPGTLAYASGPDAQYNYPAEKYPFTDIFAAHLHMTYNMAVILLHGPYIANPLPPLQGSQHDPYRHRVLCAASASHVTSIAESVLENAPSTSFSYMPCGMQHALHCLGIAASIHHQEMNLSQNQASASLAKQQHDKTQEIVKRLKEDISSKEHQSHLRESELSKVYRQNVAETNKPLPMQQPPYASVPSSATTDMAATSIGLSDRISVSDASSTSSSPVQSAMDVPRPRTSKQKLRRNTLTAPNNVGLAHLAKGGPWHPDMQHLQSSKLHPVAAPFSLEGVPYSTAALYNSSGSYSDPARYTSIMMQAGANASVFNHHQLPIYGNPRGTMRRQSPYPMHKAHSQEDLRGNFKTQINKTIGATQWPGQRASYHPTDLYSNAPFGSVGLDYNGSPHHPTALAAATVRHRAMRRPASMASMKMAYNAYRPQPPPMHPQHHIPPATHTQRRHTISNPATTDVLQHHCQQQQQQQQQPQSQSQSQPQPQSQPPLQTSSQPMTATEQSTMQGYYPFDSSANLAPSALMSTSYMATHSQDTELMHTQQQQNQQHQQQMFQQHPLQHVSQTQCLYTQQMEMDVSLPIASSMTLEQPPIPTEDVSMNQLFLPSDPNMTFPYMFHNTSTPASMEDLQRSEGHVV